MYMPLTTNSRTKLLKLRFILVNAILLRTIEGENWNDCMRKHHDIMGWEPYKPFDQENY
jgi:hypothetical protein